LINFKILYIVEPCECFLLLAVSESRTSRNRPRAKFLTSMETVTHESRGCRVQRAELRASGKLIHMDRRFFLGRWRRRPLLGVKYISLFSPSVNRLQHCELSLALSSPHAHSNVFECVNSVVGRVIKNSFEWCSGHRVRWKFISRAQRRKCTRD
jgi:hypothetical protein